MEEERFNPIILALDGMNPKEAIETTDALHDVIGGVKVNDLLDACGVSIIRALKRMGLAVMADPKIEDVPRTMERRVGHYIDAEADFLTIHAHNSVEAMRAAVKVAEGSDTDIVGVTVLTSLDEEECNYIFCIPTKAGVLKFARAAVLAGVPAVVSSPRELSILKGKEELTHLLDLTPGIRLEGQDPEDQKRVNTPTAAIKSGAHFLIIGSAILKHEDGSVEARRDAAGMILEQTRKARGEMISKQ